MSTKTQVLLVDDVDGGEATETISFALDGVAYEIDLNDTHAGQLRAAIAQFAEHARRVRHRSKPQRSATPSGPGRPSTNGVANGKHSSREIRDWARTAGMDVPNTGRVPQAIVEAFEAAHD